MTLAQMEAIATDLDKRVQALEDRREPASFAPQNTSYITETTNSEGQREIVTVDGSAIHSVVENEAPAVNFTATTHNGWNALSATLAEVKIEVDAPEDLIRIYALLEAQWEKAEAAEEVFVDVLIDGKKIETWTVNGVSQFTTATVQTVGGDAWQLFWLDGGTFSGGGGFPNVYKSNTVARWVAKGQFAGDGLGVIVPEGEHTISLHARPAALAPSEVAHEVKGWILQAPMLAVRY